MIRRISVFLLCFLHTTSSLAMAPDFKYLVKPEEKTSRSYDMLQKMGLLQTPEEQQRNNQLFTEGLVRQFTDSLRNYQQVKFDYTSRLEQESQQRQSLLERLRQPAPIASEGASSARSHMLIRPESFSDFYELTPQGSQIANFVRYGQSLVNIARTAKTESQQAKMYPGIYQSFAQILVDFDSKTKTLHRAHEIEAVRTCFRANIDVLEPYQHEYAINPDPDQPTPIPWRGTSDWASGNPYEFHCANCAPMPAGYCALPDARALETTVGVRTALAEAAAQAIPEADDASRCAEPSLFARQSWTDEQRAFYSQHENNLTWQECEKIFQHRDKLGISLDGIGVYIEEKVNYEHNSAERIVVVSGNYDGIVTITPITHCHIELVPEQVATLGSDQIGAETHEFSAERFLKTYNSGMTAESHAALVAHFDQMKRESEKSPLRVGVDVRPSSLQRNPSRNYTKTERFEMRFGQDLQPIRNLFLKRISNPYCPSTLTEQEVATARGSLALAIEECKSRVNYYNTMKTDSPHNKRSFETKLKNLEALNKLLNREYPESYIDNAALDSLVASHRWSPLYADYMALKSKIGHLNAQIGTTKSTLDRDHMHLFQCEDGNPWNLLAAIHNGLMGQTEMDERDRVCSGEKALLKNLHEMALAQNQVADCVDRYKKEYKSALERQSAVELTAEYKRIDDDIRQGAKLSFQRDTIARELQKRGFGPEQRSQLRTIEKQLQTMQQQRTLMPQEKSRLDAVQKTLANGGAVRTITFNLSHETCQMLQEAGIDPEKFQKVTHNELALQQVHEAVDRLEQLSSFSREVAGHKDITVLVKACTYVANATADAAITGHFDKAVAGNDLSQTLYEIGQIGYLTARFAKGLLINPVVGLAKMATYVGAKWTENIYREIQEHPFMVGAPGTLYMNAGIETAKQAAHDIVEGLRQQFETIICEQIERSPVVAQTAAEVRAQLEQLYEHHCRHVEATFYNKLRLVSEELPLRLKLLATALNAHYEQLPAGDKAEVFGDMTAFLFPGIPTRFYQCAFKYAGTALNRLFRGTPARVLQEAREIPAPQPRMVFETEFVDGEWRVVKPRDLPAAHEPKLPVKYEPKPPAVEDVSPLARVVAKFDRLTLESISKSTDLRQLESIVAELNTSIPHMKRGLTDSKDLPIWKFERLESEAAKLYDNFRKIQHDVADISKKTGIDQSIIKQVKEHLFNKEHLFKDGVRGKFDPNIDIARAWQRLCDGAFEQADLKLLLHEHVESTVMKKAAEMGVELEYADAHALANQLHDWESFV